MRHTRSNVCVVLLMAVLDELTPTLSQKRTSGERIQWVVIVHTCSGW